MTVLIFRFWCMINQSINDHVNGFIFCFSKAQGILIVYSTDFLIQPSLGIPIGNAVGTVAIET